MQRLLFKTLIAGAVTGWAIAPSFPAAAQVSTLKTVEQGQIDPAFPAQIGDAVLQAASTVAGLPIEQLTLTQASPKVWSDGCLGLAPPDQICSAVLVRGWAVTVAHQRQEWVYRTSATGQKIILDPAGSRLSRLIVPPAEQISPNQRLLKLDKSVVFQESKVGGFAGSTDELTLYKDGRLVHRWQIQPSADPSTTASGRGVMTRMLSKKAVQAFKDKLYQLHFGQFDGLRYPAPQGAADYFMVTLSNRQTTVQYAELNLNALPKDLQSVIQLWQALAKTNLP